MGIKFGKDLELEKQDIRQFNFYTKYHPELRTGGLESGHWDFNTTR